ncbi:putative Zinc finger, RING-CH-type, Zinc finger, RING/FYVE/PHD-type [Helianthus annuus]|uniref:RING-type E3 ubiquitin transferase n=1 Tax=Helianthus annuus TaxID=4232 RepID=A0A251RZQ4_HELAN|nr:putative Zinc finger, RING-CH-type, Zinc finger, RING/FYVE/PHD-type [Helianthus annuus]KAJ0459745.1 putative Zinc finger, RING-CH-type, Zinc finger, RING/FYVE/PHD-type [Helianthus annuus]
MEIAPPDGVGNLPESSSTSTDNNNLSSNRYDDEEEEEEDVCRICRNPGDADNPLRYPCACSGSIKYVHQDCLLQWLNHSNARHCEISIIIIRRQFCDLEQIKSYSRRVASLCNNCIVCKHPFSFSPVYAENAPRRLPFQEFIIGIAMKAYTVIRFFIRLIFVLSVWLLIIRFITFWIWRLSFIRSFNEAKRLFLSHISTTLILTDCLHGFVFSASIVFIFLGATSLRDYFRHLRELGGQEGDREDELDENGALFARNGEDVVGAHGIGGAGQLIRRNAENVAARWEMQAARLEAHVEQMFDGLDDGDGAEDVPFDELVGMQGPVFHLVENAFTVLASNMIFLGVVVLLPFHLGRFIVHQLSYMLSSVTSPTFSTVLPITEQALSLVNITLKNTLTTVTNSTYDKNPNVNDTALASVNIFKGDSRLTDVATLAVGYISIFTLIIFYLGVIALVRYARGEPLTMGRFYGITLIAETTPSLFRQFLAAMRHLMTMIKVAFLLVVELGVFPLMCGWWLDVCTIRMFGKSIGQRVDFFSVSPLASSLIHWVVGIAYMLQISIFVSLLRGVLRNGVLYFLRDPADPNYNPFRDLIDDPVYKHARRVLLSVAVYGSLIVMLVFLPVKLAMRMAPSIFPLDISVSDPFTEIPADMLLFQICIPFALEHFKLRATIKALLHYWFTAVGWALGLTDYLLPRPEDIAGQENENDPARLDRIHSQLGGQLGGQHRAVAGYLPPGELNQASLAEEDNDDEQSDSERYMFVLCIVLLLLVAWMTLLIFNSAIIVLPVSLGRVLFNAVPLLPTAHGIKCNGNGSKLTHHHIYSMGWAGWVTSQNSVNLSR